MGRVPAMRPGAIVGLPGAFKARFLALERGINNLARRCGESLPSPAARGTACLRRQTSRIRTKASPAGCLQMVNRSLVVLSHIETQACAYGGQREQVPAFQRQNAPAEAGAGNGEW